MSYNGAFSTSPATAASTTELSVLAVQSAPYFPTGNYQGVAVSGFLNFTTGGTAASMVMAIRNGSGTAGTVIGNPMTVTTAAATNYSLPISVIDTTNPPAAQYNVTLKGGTSANGNHVVNAAWIWVDPLYL